MIANNNLKLIVFSYSSDGYSMDVCLEKPIYIEYTTSYSELDSAKCVFVLSQQNSEFLKKGNILWIEDDICMYIDSVKINSANTISVWGNLCDSLLSKRVIFEDISFEDELISSVFQELFQSIDEIPGMTIALTNIPSDARYTGTIGAGNFSTRIQGLCKKFEYGFRVRKSTVQGTNEFALQFEIFNGTDKTESVVMSQKYGSISDFEYTTNTKDEINFVRVQGENEISVDVQLSEELTDLSKSEAFLDCTSISQEELTEEEYKAVLTEKGQEYLSEHTSQEEYSGTYTGKTFVLHTDFDIGDIVAIQDDLRSFDTTQRVTSFLKQIDTSGTFIQLRFGTPPKSLPKVIDALTKKVEHATPTQTSGSGSVVKETNIIPAMTAPVLIKTGDFIVKTSGSDTAVIIGLQMLTVTSSWENITNYRYGSGPTGMNPSEYEGLYYIVVGSGQPRLILRAEDGVWVYKALENGTSGTDNHFYLNNAPTSVAKNGDYWVKIDNTSDKKASEWYKAANDTWAFMFTFGGGDSGVTIANAILVRPEDIT